MSEKQYIADNAKLLAEWDMDENTRLGLDPAKTLYGSNKKAWWRCTKGHKWMAVISSRAMLGTGCPYCSGHKILSGYNDLITLNPFLAKEWDYDRNEMNPIEISPNSHEKAWWKCSTCGNKWQAQIKSRNIGAGCPECGKKKLGVSQRRNRLIERGSLAQNNPKLAIEWHPTKNGDLTPNDVLTGSNEKVWWLGKCGHEWQAVISSRSVGNGCPICGFKQSAKTRIQQKVASGGSLAEKNSQLAAEWHPTKNGGLSPNDVLYGSDQKIWWQCRKGHEWQAVISSRVSGVGCPICKAEQHSSFPEQAILYYCNKVTRAENRYIGLGKEIDVYLPDFNLGIEYNGKFYHRNKGKSDQAKIDYFKNLGIRIITIAEGNENRIVGDTIEYVYSSSQKDSLTWAITKVFDIISVSCPHIDIAADTAAIYEQYIFLEKENSISAKNPTVAKEWNYEKNGRLTPEMLSFASNKRVWWMCEKGHEWKAVISSRTTSNVGCPYCSGRLPIQGETDLLTVNPKLAEEWHPTKNGDLTPVQVLPNSNKRVWWRCSTCGYEWKTGVNDRNSGKGCHICAKSKQKESYRENRIKKYGSLMDNAPKIAEEWHPEKNGNLTPDKVLVGTNQKVWWLGKCGHEWEAVISSRTLQKTGCPFCSGHRIMSGYNDLVTLNPTLAKEWDYSRNYLDPTKTSPNNSQKAWWKCTICGHEWQAQIASRNSGSGCPECGKKKLGASQRRNRLIERGSLAQNNPNLAIEWHPSKNASLTPNDVLTGSHQKVWWLCPICGYEWLSEVKNRNAGRGCPQCAKRKK